MPSTRLAASYGLERSESHWFLSKAFGCGLLCPASKSSEKRAMELFGRGRSLCYALQKDFRSDSFRKQAWNCGSPKSVASCDFSALLVPKALSRKLPQIPAFGKGRRTLNSFEPWSPAQGSSLPRGCWAIHSLALDVFGYIWSSER